MFPVQLNALSSSLITRVLKIARNRNFLQGGLRLRCNDLWGEEVFPDMSYVCRWWESDTSQWVVGGIQRQSWLTARLDIISVSAVHLRYPGYAGLRVNCRALCRLKETSVILDTQVHSPLYLREMTRLHTRHGWENPSKQLPDIESCLCKIPAE